MDRLNFRGAEGAVEDVGFIDQAGKMLRIIPWTDSAQIGVDIRVDDPGDGWRLVRNQHPIHVEFKATGGSVPQPGQMVPACGQGEGGRHHIDCRFYEDPKDGAAVVAGREL